MKSKNVKPFTQRTKKIIIAAIRGFLTGVKTKKIHKGRIWGRFRDIWRVLLEILPVQKSKEKPTKN